MREMGDLKLNQLGLHFSDDQGFRIQSDTHPEIVSPQHLTKAEVRRIVALAGELHITVVPEIDSPGPPRRGARRAPRPPAAQRGRAASFGAPSTSPSPAPREIVDELMREYAALFPGRYWHLGADEYLALTVTDPEASFPQLVAAAQQKYGARATVQDLATGWLNDRAAVVRVARQAAQGVERRLLQRRRRQARQGHPGRVLDRQGDGARPPVEYLREGRKVVNLNDEYLYYVLGAAQRLRLPDRQAHLREWTPARPARDPARPRQKADRPEPRSSAAASRSGRDQPDAQTQQQVADGHPAAARRALPAPVGSRESAADAGPPSLVSPTGWGSEQRGRR